MHWPRQWLNVCVCVCVSGMPAETSRAICSMIFGGVFERLPRLRVAFAHGGGAFPGTFARIQHGFNVRPDLCASMFTFTFTISIAITITIAITIIIAITITIAVTSCHE